MYLALVYWVLGEVQRALRLLEDVVGDALPTAHVPFLINAYLFKATLETLRGDAEAAMRAAKIGVNLSREHGISIFLTWGSQLLGWANAWIADRENGRVELRRALTAGNEQGLRLWMPFMLGLLAELEAEEQGENEPLTRIYDALKMAERTGEHWSDALLHRIRGEILLKRDSINTAPAEEAFLTAIATARQQKSRSFELRAAMSMARLWRDQGKRDEARELLAPVYGWFTEGFDTLDLKQAKGLLDELS
jgi:predicted ATPase